MGILSSIFKKKKSPKGSIPDFLVIGVQKGGTTSLFDMLGEHPDVHLPEVKEIHYFDLFFDRGWDWYKGQFPQKKDSHSITGEASPYYIYHPLVPNRIKDSFEPTKLPKCILILRNPIDRAYSHYQMEYQRGNLGDVDFKTALEREPEMVKMGLSQIRSNPFGHPRYHQEWSFLGRGNYVSQLDRWIHILGKDSLLVLKSEDFFSNPKEVMKVVQGFLGISSYENQSFTPQNRGEYEDMDPGIRSDLKSHFMPMVRELKIRYGISWQEFEE